MLGRRKSSIGGALRWCASWKKVRAAGAEEVAAAAVQRRRDSCGRARVAIVSCVCVNWRRLELHLVVGGFRCDAFGPWELEMGITKAYPS